MINFRRCRALKAVGLRGLRSVVTQHCGSMDEQTLADSFLSLQEKGNRTLAVTEFITQYDELRQIRLENQPRVETRHMALGSRVHEILEHKLEVDPAQQTFPYVAKAEMDRDVTHFIDFIDKIIALGSHGESKYAVVRELPMRGSPPGSNCILRGVIDCVYVGAQGIVIMETKTTTNLSPTLTRLAYHQALTYYWLFNKLLTSEENIVDVVASMFRSKRETVVLAHEYLEVKAELLKNAVARLSAIGLAPYINLQFLKPLEQGVCEEQIYEVEYNEQALKQQIRARTDLFSGKRHPYGFSLRDASAALGKQVVLEDEAFDEDTLTASQRAALHI